MRTKSHVGKNPMRKKSHEDKIPEEKIPSGKYPMYENIPRGHILFCSLKYVAILGISTSSLSSLFLSSHFPITSFTTPTPPPSSPFLPTMVVSSAKRSDDTTTVLASELPLSQVLVPEKDPPGTHLNRTPTPSPPNSRLCSSACLITAWW